MKIHLGVNEIRAIAETQLFMTKQGRVVLSIHFKRRPLTLDVRTLSAAEGVRKWRVYITPEPHFTLRFQPVTKPVAG